MRTVISLASVFACVFSMDAQITATLKRFPDGLEVRIRNNSATSLVAFVVAVNQVPRETYSSHAPFIMYSEIRWWGRRLGRCQQATSAWCSRAV